MFKYFLISASLNMPLFIYCYETIPGSVGSVGLLLYISREQQFAQVCASAVLPSSLEGEEILS